MSNMLSNMCFITLSPQVSDGGVHSHITQLFALIEAAKELGVPRCFVQFFSDGRDTRPTSGGNKCFQISFTTQLGFKIVIE